LERVKIEFQLASRCAKFKISEKLMIPNTKRLKYGKILGLIARHWALPNLKTAA